uniref:Uncharacterized protein n=1 Tax=Octopus bimaculoides TaxID=37653 RepID=A0A0L8FSV2_OCTBM
MVGLLMRNDTLTFFKLTIVTPPQFSFLTAWKYSTGYANLVHRKNFFKEFIKS